jgi:hypothetical protein
MQGWNRASAKCLFLVMVGLLSLCSTNAFAAIIYIPDQYPTIQEGIDGAVAGDTVIVRDGTYSEALDFNGKAITLKSENGANNCFLDGQQQTRVLHFHSSEEHDSVLDGFTIQNGKADIGGAIYCDVASPTIKNCIITGNQAYVVAYAGAAYGGGICCISSSPKIDSCTISNNLAAGYTWGYGGGIYCSASSPEIINCNISGNTSQGFGGCSPSGAWAGHSYGGGIYFDGGAPIIIDSIVNGNKALAGGCGPTGGSPSSYGGGIYSNACSPSIQNCSISNNYCTATTTSGGGIYFSQSFPSLVNTIVNGNSSNIGGGLYFVASSSIFTNCVILRNTAVTSGGGIYNQSSSPSIINSILWQNIPDQLFKDNPSNPTVTYSNVTNGYEGIGNINSDPGFVNIAGQDFHLTSESPCIDVGENTAPELPTKDKDGNPRVVGGTVDMGVYEHQPGSLMVTISPPAAVSAGAQWSVDGGGWHNTGDIVSGLSLSQHTVSFKSISGWTTPTNQTVTIMDTQTASASGTYVVHTGSLTVNLLPLSAVSSGAQWAVEGGGWHNSGESVPELSLGQHTVSFKPITGWNTPGNQTVTVNNGQTTSSSGTYVLQTGSLSVNLMPLAAVNSGAQWAVDGTAWHNSGDTVLELSLGQHTVSFKAITGWNAPVNQSVTVNNGQTTVSTGDYSMLTGSLTVSIKPQAAVAAGARWKVDNGTWKKAGQVVKGLSYGPHVIKFKKIRGWATPANKTISILNSATKKSTGKYVHQ